jgi:hypothetical protein
MDTIVVILRFKKERKSVHTIKRRTANWTDHILLKNFLLKCITEGKKEGVKERRRRRGKQLLDDLKEKRGCWKLKEEALDHNHWRTLLGTVRKPVIRQTRERMHECAPFVFILHMKKHNRILQYTINSCSVKIRSK